MQDCAQMEEMFGRGKSEGKIGRIGQTFLPFA